MASQKNWNQLHDEIKVNLQKEVYLMRELLANLHQEILDKEHSIQIMQQRQSLLERLNQARELRLVATQKLETLIDPSSKDLKLEQIMPLDDEQTTEVLSLNDQLGALTKKMNQQNMDNQSNLKQERRLKPKTPRKKTAIATEEKIHRNSKNPNLNKVIGESFEKKSMELPKRLLFLHQQNFLKLEIASRNLLPQEGCF